MPIILKTDEVSSMLDMKKGIEITEQVLQELSRGHAKVHAPYHLAVPNGAIRVVSAALEETGTVGLRYGRFRHRYQCRQGCNLWSKINTEI